MVGAVGCYCSTWSHPDKPHSVRLLWTRDQSVAETSTWQHTSCTCQPCFRRDSNTLQSRKRTPADPCRWLRGHWDRLDVFRRQFSNKFSAPCLQMIRGNRIYYPTPFCKPLLLYRQSRDLSNLYISMEQHDSAHRPWTRLLQAPRSSLLFLATMNFRAVPLSILLDTAGNTLSSAVDTAAVLCRR